MEIHIILRISDLQKGVFLKLPTYPFLLPISREMSQVFLNVF